METISNLTFTPVDVTQFGLDNKVEPILDDSIATVRTRYTDKFYYYKNDNIIGTSLQHYGEYTQPEIDFLNNFLTPQSIVYDIGSNIGYHSLAFAEKAKHVYTFEPNNKNFRLLQMNTRHKKNVTNYNIACSNKTTKAYIQDFDTNISDNYGECKLSDTGQLTDCVRLSDFQLEKNIPHPTLIKIDVEGHEYEVIDGMRKILQECRTIIFYEHMYGKLSELHTLLENLLYKFYWFPVLNYNPYNYKNNQTNIFGNGGVLNMVAIPHTIKLNTNLHEKLHKDETWQDCVKRIQTLNAQNN